MNINYLRIQYFLAAARTSSFSKAATELYISSQALTKQINLLEEEIGGKLFERTSKGVRLTELGSYAQRRLDKVNTELVESFRDIQIYAKNNKEVIRIGIFRSLPQEQIVTPVITYLLGTFQNYQINIELVDLSDGKKALLEGQIDLLLTNTHEEDNWYGRHCLVFKEAEAKVVISFLHPWFVKEEITLEDMKQANFLKMKVEEDAYLSDSDELFYSQIPCKTIREVNNFSTMLALLQQGDYFSIFPMVFSHMDKSKLKCFAYPGRRFMYRTGILYNPQLERMTPIIEGLKEEFALKEYGDQWRAVT